tara:strand:+ start:159 stop:659 length:501 start_codon:yes stop_codon:yes gene_type:complete
MSYVIYKIVCDDLPDYVYVGSTSAFRQRKAQHKSDCNNETCKTHNIKLYKIIRDNGDWDNWRMMIINECEEGISKTQAHIIEEEFRVKLNANMNSNKCYLTKDEVHANRIVNDAKYRNNNKELISEKVKETMTCICGSIFRKYDLNRHLKTKKHLNLMESLGENEI